jgi:hypothetical protein
MPTVTHAQTEFEAEAIRAVLADAGIRSLVVPCGSNVFGFPMAPGGKGIPVKVLEEDLSRAREVLSRARFVGRSVDWDDADLGEMAPEVRAALEKRGGARRVGGVLAAAGGVIAVLLVILLLGGFLMTIWNGLRGVRVLALAAALGLLAGCAYTLEGRAVEGHGTIEVGEKSMLDGGGGRPVAGVSVVLIRDPTKGNRAQVASAVSGKDGTFKLVVSDFGAGWMQEEWLVRASRSGYQNVETITALPAGTGGQLMLVGLARGRSTRFQDPETSDSLLNEARKYDSGVGSMTR